MGRGLRVAGLFAGIGGLELGLASAGHHAAILSEIFEPARAVLRQKFSDSQLVGDICGIRQLPPDVDLIAAGFPCQDLSQAGRTKGISGERSGLVGQIFRLLDAKPTPWVVLENVPFMLQLDRGRGMQTIVDALEERGYRWAYRVVNTLAFLPQRRERVIFVATSTDADPADVVLADEVQPPSLSTSLGTHAHGFYWTEGVRGLGWAQDAIPTLKNGSTIGIPSPPAILMPNGEVVTPQIRDAERLQGFEEDWTLAAEGVARASSRWSLIGNAVSVPVAAWLGGKLASPGAYERDRDRPLPENTRWPRAARFDGKQRHAVEINSFPAFLSRPGLADFLRYPGKPLSARASQGFLSRTEKGTLRFVPGFKDRVREHLVRVSEGPHLVAAE